MIELLAILVEREWLPFEKFFDKHVISWSGWITKFVVINKMYTVCPMTNVEFKARNGSIPTEVLISETTGSYSKNLVVLDSQFIEEDYITSFYDR